MNGSNGTPGSAYYDRWCSASQPCDVNGTVYDLGEPLPDDAYEDEPADSEPVDPDFAARYEAILEQDRALMAAVFIGA